jgi:3-hydroxyisobutyrate dehydrogenase-like beta-hydroxyacid dehydrogenase
MGYPMAGHLARAGHPVTVYNRTAARAQQWLAEHPDAVRAGAKAAETPAEAARGAAFVFACTGNEDDLREIATGESGAFAGMKPGAIFVDHTTVSAQLAGELALEAERRGLGFLDAPVSGGQGGAEGGVLTIMVGGSEVTFEAARPLLACYARKAVLMGPAGSGQLTKLVNQICLGGLIQALAEGLHFAHRAGLDGRRAVEVISQGAAQSWQMDNRAETMLAGEFEFGFAVDWMRKDLGFALAEARRNGARLPVTELVDHFYAELQARGGGRWDTSSLIARLE